MPDRPSSWMPPQTWLGESWRLLLCLALSGLVWGQMASHQWNGPRQLFWIDLIVGVLSFPVAVLLRRRWPFAVAMALALTGIVSSAAAGPGVLAAVSYATRRQVVGIVTLGVTSLVSGWAYTELEPKISTDPKWLDVGFSTVVTVAILVYGMYVGSRRELIWSLRQRAEDAEQQQELRLEQARARERERIAREMHDILAHRISLITMHAGALSYRSDLPPEQVGETAQLIASTSRAALTDLREVLGALREHEPVRPQPTLAELRDLVRDANDSGMRVEVESTLSDTTSVPQHLGRAIYRMVQEALTNARKHAPGVPVNVALSGSAGDGIRVRVRNGRAEFRGAAAVPGSGLGLVGMRERFELAGGHLDVEETRNWFVIEGWLPWPA